MSGIGSQCFPGNMEDAYDIEAILGIPANGSVSADIAVVYALTRLVSTTAALSRRLDTINSTTTPLAPAASFPGGWASNDSGGSIWITGTAAAAGTLYLDHNIDGVTGSLITETWFVAAGESFRFPSYPQYVYHRVRFTDTGGGGALTLTTTLHPQAYNPFVPITRTNYTALGATPATVTIKLPAGSRRFCISSFLNGTARAMAWHCWATNAGNTHHGPCYESAAGGGTSYDIFNIPAILEDGSTPTHVTIASDDINPGQINIDWYP